MEEIRNTRGVYPTFYINNEYTLYMENIELDEIELDTWICISSSRRREGKMKMVVASEAAGGKCKKHPEQEQLPGVCSACLRERLFQLYGCKSQNNMSMNMMGVYSCSSSRSSSSPPYSSASSSTHISPKRGSNHHRRASEVTAEIAMVIGGGWLKKSRSIAVVPSGRGGDIGKTKKEGFWSKLLGPRGDRRSKGAFMHS